MFYTVHPKSRELLTVALALTALASTLFSRKVSSQVLIGQSLGEDEGSCLPSLQDLSVGGLHLLDLTWLVCHPW